MEQGDVGIEVDGGPHQLITVPSGSAQTEVVPVESRVWIPEITRKSSVHFVLNHFFSRLFFVSIAIGSHDSSCPLSPLLLVHKYSRGIVGQAEVKFLFVVLDVVNFIDDGRTVVNDVRGGMTDGQSQGTSIIYFVDGSDSHIVLSICLKKIYTMKLLPRQVLKISQLSYLTKIPLRREVSCKK